MTRELRGTGSLTTAGVVEWAATRASLLFVCVIASFFLYRAPLVYPAVYVVFCSARKVFCKEIHPCKEIQK